jgi:hypothetical protein
MEKGSQAANERAKKSMSVTGLLWIVEAIVVIGLIVGSYFFGFGRFWE